MKRQDKDILLKDAFTISQAVKKSGMPKRSIYNRIERGAITPFVFGERYLLDKKTVTKLKREYLTV